MRWVVLILALGGAGGSGYLGFNWFTLTDSARTTANNTFRPRANSDPFAKLYMLEYDAKHNGSVFLMGSAVLAILGGLLAVLRRGILAALTLIVAFAGPAVITHEWLLQVGERVAGLMVFTGALLLAGLLAFFVRPKKVIPEDERAYAGV